MDESRASANGSTFDDLVGHLLVAEKSRIGGAVKQLQDIGKWSGVFYGGRAHIELEKKWIKARSISATGQRSSVQSLLRRKDATDSSLSQHVAMELAKLQLDSGGAHIGDKASTSEEALLAWRPEWTSRSRRIQLRKRHGSQGWFAVPSSRLSHKS